MIKKITVTTGTRAEYGILRSLLKEIKKSKKLKLFLLVTGSHLSKKHGYTIKDIKKDHFKISYKIPVVTSDNKIDVVKGLGFSIAKFATIFEKIKPDFNLVLGDRDEMLASSIAAYHMDIPNVHIHGGDVSGGIDEYTRHAITKISNIHFVATEKSKKRVLRMGENPKYVFVTGSLSLDELVQGNFTDKKTLMKKYNVKLDNHTIILLQHPVTTQNEYTEKQIKTTLKAISQIGYQTIAISPNTDPGNSKIFKQLNFLSKKYKFVNFYASLPREDYLGFLKYSGVLVGNSSSGLIEGSYFGIPVINIGSRQLRREKAKNVIDVTNDDSDAIKRKLLSTINSKKNRYPVSYIYGKGNSSKKIVKYLETIKISKELIEKQYYNKNER